MTEECHPELCIWMIINSIKLPQGFLRFLTIVRHTIYSFPFKQPLGVMQFANFSLVLCNSELDISIDSKQTQVRNLFWLWNVLGRSLAFEWGYKVWSWTAHSNIYPLCTWYIHMECKNCNTWCLVQNFDLIHIFYFWPNRNCKLYYYIDFLPIKHWQNVDCHAKVMRLPNPISHTLYHMV